MSGSRAAVLTVLVAALAAWFCGCSSPSPTGPTPPATSTITGCTTITAAGSYVLASDLPATSTCILNITGATSVQLDCRNHIVPQGLGVTQSQDIKISNCTVGTQLVMIDVSRVEITSSTINAGQLTMSTSVVFTQSRIGGQIGDFSVTNVTGVRFSQDTFVANARVTFGTDVQFTQDTFIANTGPTPLKFQGGSNNQVIQSKFTGGYDSSAEEVGVDDAVVLINETGDTIQSNTFSDFFDAAVETASTVTNTTIADNTFANIGVAGIGSYWCTAWSGNTIRHNTSSQTPFLIYVLYATSGGLCQSPVPAAMFSGTQIVDNSFRSPIAGVVSLVGPAPHARISITMSGTVQNNTLTGNDLGANEGPFVSPLSGFIDGGGNICGSFVGVSDFPCSLGGATLARARHGVGVDSRSGRRVPGGPRNARQRSFR